MNVQDGDAKNGRKMRGRNRKKKVEIHLSRPPQLKRDRFLPFSSFTFVFSSSSSADSFMKGALARPAWDEIEIRFLEHPAGYKGGRYC